METVQVDVLGLRWRSRLKTQTGDDREGSAAGGNDYELNRACQRPAGLCTVVLHVSIALGGFSATIAGTCRRWRRVAGPATAGRETSLLLEVLDQTFKGDVRGSLDEFEVKIRRCERSCNEVLSDRVKIAVVQKGIEDEDLRRHVLMHASHLSTSPLVREEIRSIIMARETLNGPTTMGVSAIYKGKKGKQKYKGKSDDKEKEKDPAANPDPLLSPEGPPQARLQGLRERQ